MSERELFVKLEEKYKELCDLYEPLLEDSKAFEGGPEYEAYNKLTEDEVKKMLFPEQYEMYAKIAEMEPKLEAFEREIANAGKEFVKKLNEEMQKFEKKIATNKEHIAKIEQEIQAKEQEIAALKETEAYKNGDEETILKVEDLELEVKAKKLRKEQLEDRITSYEKELEEAKAEKTSLLEDYPELEETTQQVEQPIEEQQVEEQQVVPEASNEEEEPKGNKGETEDKDKPKTSKKEGRTVAATTLPTSNEEPAKKEEKDPKKEFKELVSKAKKGTLDDKEFDKLVEIMKNPKSYEEFGITTGIIFNSSRGIFKALEKSLDGNEKISKEVKNIFDASIVGDLEDKELLEKIAKLEKDGLDEKQQAVVEKVKSALNKQESLKQAKDVRDIVALEKNEKRWSWLIDFSEDKKRLGEAKAEPGDKSKSTAGIPGLSEQTKSEDEKNKSYGEPVQPPSSKEEISHETK